MTWETIGILAGLALALLAILAAGLFIVVALVLFVWYGASLSCLRLLYWSGGSTRSTRNPKSSTYKSSIRDGGRHE